MGLLRRKREVTVDLTEPTESDYETIRRVRAQTPGGQITFGAPTRCPECSTYGYVERVDVVAGCTDNRCTACGTEWRINRRALQSPAPALSDVAPIGTAVVGRGILVRDLLPT
jgi:hypothetical protein